MAGYTPYQSQWFAHFLTREGLDSDGLTQSLSAARVDLNPHQVDAAMFALRSPLSKGVLLADEVGLGKTIEAALVLAQRWWERRRHLLLIVPASLRKQWAQELQEKFSLPSVILDAKRMKDLQKAGQDDPLGSAAGIIILSYEFAARVAEQLRKIPWDLVVFDEAHKLRNVYRAPDTARASILRRALNDADVLRKADAAVLWCHVANQALPAGEKPWRYLLVPHDAINASATLSGLISQFSRQPSLDLMSRYQLAEAS